MKAGVRCTHVTSGMYSETPDQQLESIRRGIAELEAGHYIPHERMKTWLLYLSLGYPSPPPKCVCGEFHDGRGNIHW